MVRPRLQIIQPRGILQQPFDGGVQVVPRIQDDDRRPVPVQQCIRAWARDVMKCHQILLVGMTMPAHVVAGEDGDGPRIDRILYTEAFGVVSRGG